VHYFGFPKVPASQLGDLWQQLASGLLSAAEQAATSRLVVRVRVLEVKLAARAAALSQAAALNADPEAVAASLLAEST
jgi:hypothetical protein